MKQILSREHFVDFNLGNSDSLQGPPRFSEKPCGERWTLKRVEKRFGTIDAQFVDIENGKVFLFTATETISIADYDGKEFLCRVPRNPVVLLDEHYRLDARLLGLDHELVKFEWDADEEE